MSVADEITRARCAHLTATELRLARLWLGVEMTDVAGPPEGLIVGEAPGPHTSGRLPMFPWPASSAAGRLLKMSGMRPGEYLGRFFRRNLWDDFAASEAGGVAEDRERAREIKDWIAATGSVRVLLLGSRVGKAFDIEPWGAASGAFGSVLVTLRCIPHPSGRSLAYNDPRARQGAQAAVLWAAGFV